jgi:large subunit ribosomal protein L2
VSKIVRRKPTSPGMRHRIDIYSDHLFRGKPRKSLVTGVVSVSGRDRWGRITTRHRGGGNKGRVRVITHPSSFRQRGLVLSIEQNPSSNAHLALVKWVSVGQNLGPRYSYIKPEDGLRAGDNIFHNEAFLVKGSAYMLGSVPEGEKVYGLERVPGKGAQIATSAGSFCRILKHDQGKKTTLLELPSKERREFNSSCMAKLGSCSNPGFFHVQLGKAGRARWRGFRPTVRGEAMNAVDHPHGGNSAGGGQPRTPWGKLAKWIPKP